MPLKRKLPDTASLRGDKAAVAICTVVRRIPRAGSPPMAISPRWPASAFMNDLPLGRSYDERFRIRVHLR
jgi:hypothetical protein